ncbi:MAG: DNA recombination protein RmuC [Gallionella sp.]|nr:DNA recombination protein RmuC [Gallionella sp.]
MQIEMMGGWLLGIALGGIAVWFVLREKIATASAVARSELESGLAVSAAALDAAKAEVSRLEQERMASQQRAGSLLEARDILLQAKVQAEADSQAQRHRAQEFESRLNGLMAEHEALRAECNRLSNLKAELETRLKADAGSFTEKLELLEKAKQSLSDQFNLLANRIFEEKSKSFSELNQEKLATLLAPLGEKLKDFETKVQTVYDNEAQQRSALKSEITRLVEANAKISVDANNLARALKGDTQKQGAWGEMILERILEMSGLRKDREYRIQQSYSNEAGERLRPDVIIDLPEHKHIVVDSKVSLNAYERMCAAETPEAAQEQLKLHVASLRAHVAGLSGKEYQKIYHLKTLDFVLLFVPIESAFFAAVQADQNLFQEAMEKNVMIVCPSTLLGTLRIVANIWRYEHQSQNAQEIARQAGALYDKFVGFIGDIEEVGARLGKAHDAYEAAHKKLTTGRGNLVGSAEKLRQLGVKPSKTLHAALTERAAEADPAGRTDAEAGDE